MAINLTKIIDEIQIRNNAIDSNTSSSEQLRLNSITTRMNSMGGVLTYRSTGHLPSTADSGHIGSIAYVASDNVFGDSSGAFYMATFRDSNWVKIPSLQDSDEGAIPEPSGPSAPTTNPSGGTAYGYAIGGSPYPTGGNVIERFSFTVDGNSTDVGDLTHAHYAGGIGQSLTHAYYMGGTEELAPVYYTNRIQKIQFASSGNATELSYYLTGQRSRMQNGVHTTPTHAFLAGGYRHPGGFYSEIQKYSYTDDANASDTGGDLSSASADFAGQMSPTHAYLTGGTPSVNPDVGKIYKYPFAITSGTEAAVGDLTPQYTSQHDQAGASSATHGYVFQGTIINAIEKFPFAADANSTDVGNLAQTAWRSGCTQSTSHGYNLGGSSPAVSVNNIQKFDFSSDGDGTDVGDLSAARTYVRGAAE